MTTTAIADLALLSDRHSSALVDAAGTIQWLAFPRFDSPSVFGRLLGADAGLWRIAPSGMEDAGTGAGTIGRRYLDGTLVLETTFRTPTGTLVVTDALATGEDENVHRLGAAAPHLLIRAVECTDGTVDVAVRYVPRPEYGLVVPLLSPVPGGVAARGGRDRLVLSSPVELALEAGEARAVVSLSAGERLVFGV